MERSDNPPQWQRELAEAVTDLDTLLAELDLDPSALGELAAAAQGAAELPVRVPRSYLGRMRRADPADPLLRQVLPTADEARLVPGFSCDPVGELGADADGVLSKYRGRALLLVTGACAVHCRYCFRRHQHRPVGPGLWDRAVARVRADASVTEVILSGGDPLTVPDPALAELARRLAEVPHLKRLRIHTRLPVVVPARVDDALTGWLTGTRLQPVVVLHANHPGEVDHQVAAACGRLRSAGVLLLNQSVLLAGVNDDAAALAALSHALVACGVLPYYLHQLDRVQGAAHFEVPDARALELVADLAAAVPGYMVPRLVREVAGEPAKTPLRS